MSLDNIAFYNLGNLEPIPGHGDWGLVRIPAHTRNQLNLLARDRAMASVGVEIRFVTDAPMIDLYISALRPTTIHGNSCSNIRVYKGNYLVNVYQLEPEKPCSFRIATPTAFAISNDTMTNPGGYSSNVWRIVCNRAVMVFHGIDTFGYELRPPCKEELPKYNWLAYGSSITNADLDSYVHVAAANLRLQVQNKGLGGSCHIEKAMVDYMLDECESDFITCELGINMRSSFLPEEFKERAEYLINRLCEMKKPAVIITTFPNAKTNGYVEEYCEETKREDAYEEILTDLVNTAHCKTLTLVKGKEILTDICGLSADLLHPTAYGHAVMGINLSRKLKPFLLEHGLT